MKICFVSPKNYPLFNPDKVGNFGGAETQLYYLSTKLAVDPRYIVSMIVHDFGQPAIEKNQNVLLYKYTEQSNFWDKIKYIRYFVRFVKLFALFKLINADIYIQRCKIGLTIYTALFCKILKKKFVFMTASEADVIGTIKKDLPLFNKTFHDYGIKKSDLILVQNNEQQKLLKKNFNLESYTQKSVCPVKHLKSKEGNYILWVGRAVAVKEPEKLFELAQQNPDKNFIMICKSVPHEVEYFEKTKNNALKIENIQFIEHVPFNEIDQFFQNVKIFVNTSAYEGFPNTFIEAWKNGIPVISLNVNPDDIITAYSLGFCSKTISQMNKDIDLLYSDEKLYKKLSNSAYLYVKKNHNLEVIIEEFKRHLYSIVDEGL